MSKKKELSVKEQMEAINKSLAWFDGDEFNLDEAFAHYEVVAKQVEDLKQTLTTMKNKIEVITTLHSD